MSILAWRLKFCCKYCNTRLMNVSRIESYEKKLYSKGVGIIDSMIIAYAIKYNIKIWSLDKKLLSVLEKSLTYKL